MAELRATPYANPLTGLSNEAIQGLLAFMQDKRRTQQLQGLGNLLESTGIPKTVERAAYAESPRGLLDALTNVNRANVPFLKPETAEAAMTLAPIAAPVNRALMQATKGLPVGATIKNVGKDLSAIQIGDRTIPVTINRIDKKSGGELVNVNPTAFDEAFSKTSWQYVGEKGKEGISGRYEKFENFLKDAKSIEASNVSVNKDGGIVFGDGRHRYAVLRDMGLDELPIVMDKESIKNAKKFGYLADTPKKPSYPQQEALDTAQRNAALPFEEGGLGLPKNNTPEMRAEAMGFDLSNPQYHATDAYEDFTSIRPSARGKMGAGIYTSPEASYAEKYGGNKNKRILPMVLRGEYADADSRENIFDMVRGELYQKNPNFTSQELNNAVSQEMQRKGYSGFDVDKERVTFIPDEIRSRFAAFDPFRMNTETASARGVAPPDLLAGVLPLGLLTDEDQRKKLYEMLPSLLGQ